MAILLSRQIPLLQFLVAAQLPQSKHIVDQLDVLVENSGKSSWEADSKEVPEETWAAWNAVFDRLDNDGDNVMSPSELRPFQCWDGAGKSC